MREVSTGTERPSTASFPAKKPPSEGVPQTLLTALSQFLEAVGSPPEAEVWITAERVLVAGNSLAGELTVLVGATRFKRCLRLQAATSEEPPSSLTARRSTPRP